MRAVRVTTSLAVAALGLCACGGGERTGTGAAATASSATPVIVYLIDTLRADRLGLYGYERPTSPRIDALARESVVFEQAYAAAPWTLPSVASLVTSRYPCEHGVVRMRLALSPELPTLAERLQGLGYATAAYYQNIFAGPIAGLNRGYQLEEFRDRAGSLDGDTREFLARAGDRPFLLYLHSVEPHTTYLTPPEMIRRLGHVGIDEREAYRAHWTAYRTFWYADYAAGRAVGSTDTTEGIDAVREALAGMRPSVERLYDAAVLYADTELGQTVDALRESGVWDRALFIVLSDHGEEMGEHGLWFHDQSLYEELIHVPLLVHFPGGAYGGRRVTERVSLLDVMPTILDYLGHAELCTGCSGSSLLPLVDPGRGRGYAPAEVPAVRMNSLGYYRPLKERAGDVNVALREGAHKLIWHRERGRFEHYDLANDAREQRDLAGVAGDGAAARAARAAQWLAGCEARRVPPVELPPEAIDEPSRARLRAHGYFGP